MCPLKKVRWGLKPMILLLKLNILAVLKCLYFDFTYRLPSVSKLNGSVVTEGEREDSERFFIRYYVDVPEEEVPFR